MLFGVDISSLIYAAMVMWVIIVIAEGMKRLGWIQGENARKLIHVSTGLFLATLPLYMNRREILLINLCLLAGLVILSGVFHLLHAIDDVRRWTLGQFLYPLGIVLVVLVFQDPIVYSFGVLVLALADGLAAIFGKWRGEWKYRALGGYKTVYGSLVFFATTLVLMGVFVFAYSFTPERAFAVLVGAILLTVVEGAFAGGFDNLFLPMMAAAMLNYLQ